MPTHGAAREKTICDLQNLRPFERSSFSAVAGPADSTGRMEGDTLAAYKMDRDGVGIAYTVLSYATPIAWVRSDGTAVIPGDGYSATTGHQQTLCRVYLPGQN